MDREDTMLMGAGWALIVSGMITFIYLLAGRGTWWVPPLGTALAGVMLIARELWRRWRHDKAHGAPERQQ